MSDLDALLPPSEPARVDEALDEVVDGLTAGKWLVSMRHVVLASEVVKLRRDLAETAAAYQCSMDLARTYHGRIERLTDEVARLRAIVPALIGCSQGNWANCGFTYLRCCARRRLAQEDRLITPAEDEF